VGAGTKRKRGVESEDKAEEEEVEDAAVSDNDADDDASRLLLPLRPT
jgi:hypothetical protein